MSDRTATHPQRPCVLASPGSDGKESRRTHPCAPAEEADAQLLERWRRERCTDAFAKLVARHTAWICAVARRRVKDRHLAEDVTQAVFLILSRKAGRISPETPLAAWLFRVTRFAANDALKREARRRRRMEVAATYYSEVDEPGGSDPDIDVDECIACLGEVDRQVILLRFYEEKSMAQVAAVMGTTEHAAKKRVARALNRLRRIFARRGIRVGSLLSVMCLLKQVALPDSASAEVLGQQITQASIGATAPNAPISELANATLRSLATAHARILAAMAGASVVLCLAVTTLSPVMGQAILPFLKTAGNAFVSPITQGWWFTASAPVKESSVSETAGEQPIRQVWAGRLGEFAWPVLPGPGGSISLQAASSSGGAVAIIEDQHGLRWIRKVDAELIPPPQVRDELRTYDELNPYANSPYQQALLTQIAQDLEMFDHSSSASGDSWRPFNGLRVDDNLTLPEDLYIQYAEQTGPSGEAYEPITVPEPAIAAIAGAMSVPLLLRRRASGSVTRCA